MYFGMGMPKYYNYNVTVVDRDKELLSVGEKQLFFVKANAATELERSGSEVALQGRNANHLSINAKRQRARLQKRQRIKKNPLKREEPVPPYGTTGRL